MLIALEIILTVVAWNRGWRWWTLISWPVAFGAAFLISLARGVASGFIADIVLIGTLVGMVVWRYGAKRIPRVTDETE